MTKIYKLITGIILSVVCCQLSFSQSRETDTRRVIIRDSARLGNEWRKTWPTGLDRENGVIEGCIVSWNSLLKFNITAGTYFINSRKFTKQNDSVTLTAAHATLPRIDAIVVDTFGRSAVITGTPNATPGTPNINSALYVYRAYFLIPANSTTPFTLDGCAPENLLLYDEATQPPEWNVGSQGFGTLNVVSTSRKYSGAVSIVLRPFTNGNILTFNDPNTVLRNINTYANINFHIYVKDRLSGNAGIDLQFFQTSPGTTVSNTITLQPKYGFSKNALNQWQNITIPLSDFNFISNQVDAVRFVFNGSNTDSLFIDKVVLQTCVGNVNSLGNFVSDIYRVPGTDSVKKVINGVPQFAYKDSTGGGANGYKKIEVTTNYTVANDITHVIAGIGFIGTITLPAASSHTGRIIYVSTDGASATISPAHKYFNNVVTGTTQEPGTTIGYISDGTNWQKINISQNFKINNVIGTGTSIISSSNTGLDPINSFSYYNLKRISPGTNISITSNSDSIIINATGGGGDVTLNGVQTITNKTLTAPVINSPTGITKSDVGLGNVDNTSNATERAATATLTNKTMDGDLNTFQDIPFSAIKTTDTDNLPVELGFAISDETTDITTGTAKITFRMPFAMTVTSVRFSLTAASTSGIPTVDINEAGTTILSTKLTIDANEKTSTTAATAFVLSDTTLADDAEITMDIDVSGTGAKGAKIWIIGKRN